MRLVIVALALWLPVSGASAAPDYKAIELAAVDAQIAPGFRQFGERAAALQQTVEAFCRKPDAKDLPAVRAGFNAVMDAWQGVQHIGFGPVELFNRGQRVQFWPDKRNASDRQLLALIRDRKTADVTLARMPIISVGVQGLPALELLLFGDGQSDKLLVPGPDADFRCHLVTLISANLAAIGNDLADDFSRPDGFRAAIEVAGTAASRYANHREAALQLFNALYGQLHAISEAKLTYPMGAKLDEARAQRGESWRSKRSLWNIVMNLEAVKATFGAAFAPALAAEGKSDVGTRLAASLEQTIAHAKKLPPMEEAVTRPAGWKTLSDLKAQVKASAKLLEEAGGALNLQVGFNALDGD